MDQQKEKDIALFYSLAIVNEVRQKALDDSSWGSFIQYQESPLSYPPQKKPFHIPYKEKIDFANANGSPIFQDILNKINSANPDKQFFRSSSKFYIESFDLLVNNILMHKNHQQRIVEIGPQFGDLSCQLAGLLNHCNVTLDLVDIDKENLYYAYKNISAVFPEVLPRVRLFYGDLPIYIKNVINQTNDLNNLFYQGSYNFNDVIRDLGSTYFAKDKIAGIFISNTHLRNTNMNYYPFIDAAIYALFGMDVKFFKLGEEKYEETALQQDVMHATYLSRNRVDGMYIPLSHNQFRYPHPNNKLDDFIYKKLPA